MLTKSNKKFGFVVALVFATMFFSAQGVKADILADPSHLTGSDTVDFGYNSTNSNKDVCQSFTATNDNLTGVSFKLRRIMPDATWTAQSKTFTAQVQTDATGCDYSGATIVDTVTLNTADTITAFPYNTDTVYEFDLNGSLTIGNEYFVVLRVSNYNVGVSMRAYYENIGTYADGSAWWNIQGVSSSTWTDKAPDDLFFAVYGDSQPVEYNVGPTTTIYSPPDNTNVPSSNFVSLEARATSDILSASATQEVTFDWLIFHEGTLKGFRLDQTADLSYGAGYLADRVIFTGIEPENGRYELRARSCHGVACGVYAVSHFDVVDSSATGTDAFVLSLAPFPEWSCGILSGFFDGVDCFMSYARSVFAWFFFPPPLWAFDPTSIFDYWKTRWPVAYLFEPVESWQTGFAAGATCPMPTFFGTEFNGQTVPEYDLCDTLGSVSTSVEGNTFAKNILQWSIYLSGILAAFAVLNSIIRPK